VNISESKDEIEKCTEDVTSNFGIIPEDQRLLYFEDLNRRNLANARIENLIYKEVDMPCEVYKKELEEEEHWLRIAALDIGDSLLSMCLGYYFFPALYVYDILKGLYNLDAFEEDVKMVGITSNIFSDIFLKSDKITQNTVSGILQFKELNPQQIPEMKIVNIQDVSKGESLLGLWWNERECYTSVNVKNTGENPASVWVVASFQNCDFWHLIDGGRESLEPEESKTFRFDYAVRPKDDSLVSCTVVL